MVLAYNFTLSASIKLYALIHHKRRKNIVELKLEKESLFVFFMTHVSFYLCPILPHHLIVSSLGFLSKCCKVPTLHMLTDIRVYIIDLITHEEEHDLFFFLSLGLLA